MCVTRQVCRVVVDVSAKHHLLNHIDSQIGFYNHHTDEKEE
jgi:hypothetical protein